MDLNQKISEHFSLRECIRSETASRFNIDNTPPEDIISNIIYLCHNILEPIRNFYGIPFRPNSVYRSLELNRKIGSSDNSQHIQGEAADIEIPTVNNYDLAVWIKNHMEFDQLILECHEIGHPDSGWVHVSIVQNRGNRNQVMTYTKGQYLTGLIV